MIKIDRFVESPQILQENFEQWTQDLQKLWREYKSNNHSFTKLRVDKSEIINRYKHKTIRKSLLKDFNKKCAFCEIKQDLRLVRDFDISISVDEDRFQILEIDHFYPMSIEKYHELVYDWENLFIVCNKCNSHKSNCDPETDLIINPTVEDPKLFFIFGTSLILEKPDLNEEMYKKAHNTIEILGLNLIVRKKREIISSQLMQDLTNLRDLINRYKEAETSRKKTIRFNKLGRQFNYIKAATNPKHIFSAFCTYQLENHPIYREARRLVEENSES